MNVDPFVRFLALGPWQEHQVHLLPTPSTRLLLPEVEQAIDAAWSDGLRQSLRLFDGPMCRLESLSITPTHLTAHVSPTSYKRFYGTNLNLPAIKPFYDPTSDSPHAMRARSPLANPIGLSTALLTADQYLLFGKRNQSVAYYPGRIHPFAGSLEPDESPFAGARRELHEELSLSPNVLSPLLLLGIASDRALSQAEFIFHAVTNKTLPDLQSHLDPAEHDAIHPIPATLDAITQAIANPTQFTPVALATLWLYARHAKLIPS